MPVRLDSLVREVERYAVGVFNTSNKETIRAAGQLYRQQRNRKHRLFFGEFVLFFRILMSGITSEDIQPNFRSVSCKKEKVRTERNRYFLLKRSLFKSSKEKQNNLFQRAYKFL